MVATATLTAAGLVDTFRAARRCSTPLIAINSPDQRALIATLSTALNGDSETPKLQWDCCSGVDYLNETGKAAMATAGIDPEATQLNPQYLLRMANKLPGGTVLFLMNFHRWLEGPDPASAAATIQGVANLRDTFKKNRRSLVMLAPNFNLPPEIGGDVVLLDEELPKAEQLGQIVRGLHEHAKVKCDATVVGKAIEAVQGLPAFQAEQVIAMSLKREGLNIDGVWERKRKQIEQTPGLSCYRDGITFSDIGGLESIKQYIVDLCQGNHRPNAFVFVDEIEKMFAGSSGDTSGVSQDQLQVILTEMQDRNSRGILLVGHPGGGKSAIAKAAGNSAGVPTIRLDLGAAKGGIVGQSEAQLRAAMKTIASVSNGKAFWIATCNQLSSLPAELRRRFKKGTWFVDLPGEAERDAIWGIHRKKYGIKASDKKPNDDGWTGAEIETCCEGAWELNKPLSHAAKFVIPVKLADPARVLSLQQQADGHWLDASKGGPYSLAREAASTGRAVDLAD